MFEYIQPPSLSQPALLCPKSSKQSASSRGKSRKIFVDFPLVDGTQRSGTALIAHEDDSGHYYFSYMS
jgi:hypothetical protein